MERTRTHNLAVGSVCKLRAETLPTQPPRHQSKKFLRYWSYQLNESFQHISIYLFTYLLINFVVLSYASARSSDRRRVCLSVCHWNDIHWLPQRLVFKTALMVWKCVHGVAPAYLSDLCVPATAISGRQHLRSAATGTLLVPRPRTATGQRNFAVNGPATGNRLPPELQSPDLSESASSGHWRRTCSRPPGAIEMSSWFWRRI